MEYEKFKQLLEKSGLTPKEFARQVEMNYTSITNWKQKGIPSWVKSWLENYIKAKGIDTIAETIKPYIK